MSVRVWIIRQTHRLLRPLPLTLATSATLLTVGGVVAITVFVSQPHPTTRPKAAIIDQLAATQPDPDFVSNATTTLEQAGYNVEYIPADQVTVDLFRRLPDRDYRLILLRNHSSRIVQSHVAGRPQPIEKPVVSFFTSETYDPSKYPNDIRRLYESHYDGGTENFFGISPDFITSAMIGRLDRTVVIAMGCDGLSSDGMANALLNKGATAFISWDKPVSAEHTDRATTVLLQHLLVDRVGVGAATKQTMREVGRDPTYGSSLAYVARG